MSEDPFASGGGSAPEPVSPPSPPPAADRPAAGWWADAAQRALGQPRVRVSAVVLLAIALGTFATPLWSRYLIHVGPAEQDLVLGPQPPLTIAQQEVPVGPGDGRPILHWFGTDELGRDMLVRVGYGGRLSLLVGLVGTLVALLIGVAYGLVAGWVGGGVGRAMLALAEGARSLPVLLFVLTVLWLVGQDLLWLCVLLGSALWMRVGGEIGRRVADERRSAHADAARVSGAGEAAILVGHVLPGVTPVIVVCAASTLPIVMLAEALLSFVGLGVAAPHSSWGSLAAEGAATMDLFPWLMLFPGLTLAASLIALHWLGDGLRRALAVPGSAVPP